MYRRIQGSHSPLSPMPRVKASASRLLAESNENGYFTPSHEKNQSLRLDVPFLRSFTPLVGDLTSPAVSPIDQLDENAPNVANTTFVVKEEVAANAKSNGKLRLVIPSPQKVPLIVYSQHDESDSDASVYFTPPTDCAVTDKVQSAHRSAPKKATAHLPAGFAAKHLQMRALSPQFMDLSAASSSSSDLAASSSSDSSSLSDDANDHVFNLTLQEGGDYSILNHNIDVHTILKDLNMEHYIELFAREEIDLMVFCLLTVDDLRELDIANEDVEPLMNAVTLYADVFNITTV